MKRASRLLFLISGSAVKHDIDNYCGGSEENKYEKNWENYPTGGLRSYGNPY